MHHKQDALCRGYRIDRKYLKYFCEAFCKAADDKIVDVAMVRMMLPSVS